ncbi:hypothetical protein [Spirosoma koreense]
MDVSSRLTIVLLRQHLSMLTDYLQVAQQRLNRHESTLDPVIIQEAQYLSRLLNQQIEQLQQELLIARQVNSVKNGAGFLFEIAE